jgi:hypothetical protein
MVAAIVATFYQSALIGWWRGEAKYKGRYTNSWRAELRAYERIFGVMSDKRTNVKWFFVRQPTKWEEAFDKLFNSNAQNIDHSPPLQDGNAEAVPVLVELLQAPEANVRIIAAQGLEEIGPSASEAVPALQRALRDEDQEVAQASRQALRAINRNKLALDQARSLGMLPEADEADEPIVFDNGGEARK